MLQISRLFICVLSMVLLPFAIAGEARSSKAEQMGKSGRKLPSRLFHYVNEVASRNMNERAALAQFHKENSRLVRAKDADKLCLELDVVINDENLTAIKATGATVRHTIARWNTCVVDASLAQVKALSELDSVKLVRTPVQPRTRHQGLANNQADASQRADLVRATGLTGAGQRIGVMSDTVNRSAQVGAGSVTGNGPVFNLTGTTPQSSGDLPTTLKVMDLGEATGSDEGAAMLELIYDIAPGADLVFSSAYISEAVFADNLLKLRTQANCTITVDDIGYLETPYFQDGPVSQAIQANAAAGVIHFSAAGNDFENGLITTYVDIDAVNHNGAGDPPSNNDFHNWGIGGGSPEFLPIDVPPMESVIVVLQWNQPFKSYGLGEGSQVDLDLFLYDSSFSLLDSSASFQGTTGAPNNDPIESLEIVNDQGTTQTFYIAVDHFDGSKSNCVMRLMFFASSQLNFPLGSGTAMSMYGHPNAADCVGVGAVSVFNAPASGTVGPAEGFTSRGGRGNGGVPFYFSNTGAALPNGVERRDKPDIAAGDRSNTSFFGTDSNNVQDPDTLPNFAGTSAAAPNAAAVAALLKERAQISVSQMKALLQATARDVANGTPVGADVFTGSGFVDAKAALDALPSVNSPSNQIANAGSTATFTVTASGNTTGIQWLKNGSPITGASNASYTTPTLSFSDNNSQYACVVSNQYGSVTSAAATLTVNSPPIFVQHPADAVANAGTTANFSVNVTGTPPFTYQWTVNNNDILNADSPTYMTPVLTANDNGNQYRCRVTNGNGTVTSNPGTLTINTAPSLSSTLVVVPNPALTGQSVSFGAFASDAEGQAVTYAWTFGDGATSSGTNVSHTFASTGTFNVTVTVTDTLGLSSSSSVQVVVSLDTDKDLTPDSLDDDDDNDGVTDALEIIAGTSPLDAASTPFGGVPALGTGTLVAAKVSIKLNFTTTLKDSISISGTLPIAENFAPSGQTVVLNCGGVRRSFTLDDKGRSLKSPDGSFKVSYKKKKKNVVLEQTGKYQAKISKQTLAADLADEGLTGAADVKSVPKEIEITLFAAQQVLQVRRSVLYSAKAGKSGAAK